jgi:acyl-CoA synthetase (AMP-forming)/AMP-acid ligase II
MLRWRARRHSSLEAVWFEGKAQTFAALNESSSQLAAGFVHKLGVEPGDRVCFLDKNSAAYFELFFALDKAGVVAAPLNWRLTPHEVKQIIDDVKPKLIVAGPEFKAHGAASGVTTITFDDLPRGGDDPRRDVDGAVSTQFCTSGTTGLPKGAMLTGWNLLNVGFSNRPFRVKRFQTIHRYSVDVAHGLVLLFGIGTRAVPLWGSKTRWNNLSDDLAVRRTTDPSRHANSPHPSSREGHHSTARWSSSFLLSM